ncbi:MAG: DUF2497 domain-containing protein [Alphaproteobacteria bacterium]|nr:DUF2497 domain-containing protein [Alphaproteobacteria bacterium]MBU6472150.1 DUF2497 domain-containing protein [Alphaproteobacteria bacterium]MDE2011764.1 DUF2497 domain-containing protein [Alphaproteobacteria bacterium]MDE2074896.1 DUF2497 domain-containing protein [Alphaproteobacteria bacterium]MDE2352916.1 DUF2497 domain-containing protein [Alphaproteobacteria bacterium]
MSNPQHEPTMEEILASIRKIISEDATESQPAAAAVQPVPEPVPAAPEVVAAPAVEAEDVLELTDEVAEEPVSAVAPPADRADDIVFEPIEEPPVSEPKAVAPEPQPEPAPSSDIFSDKTRRALDDAFASIEPVDEPEAPTPHAIPPSIEGASVEAVFDRAVRETFEPVLRRWLGDETRTIVERMKPVIREWLDQNFPPMLEEAVRNEVARVAKSRRR